MPILKASKEGTQGIMDLSRKSQQEGHGHEFLPKSRQRNHDCEFLAKAHNGGYTQLNL